MEHKPQDRSPQAEAAADVADQPPKRPELLAPAGDPASLSAALQAGADAVYFGAGELNARRRARNFSREELAAAVHETHQHGARAYLTLNIELTDRDLSTAAGLLEVARGAGVDAVLVRDPALWMLKPEYPELEFHLSTQTSMTNSADVAAAARLGATRAVLAREMTIAEIAAASAVPDVETEVFVQGALCFSVSGRCLMSSWVGGRSGNRGACTSPCRVPWAVEGQPAGTPLAMHDLAAVRRIDQLRDAGVRALKIEGRMKKAAWVGNAVGLYRRILDGQPPTELQNELAELGAYTGRQMTTGFLDAERCNMTGIAGRTSSSDRAGLDTDLPTESDDDAADDTSTYRMRMLVEPRGIACRCEYGGIVDEWSIPKTVIRRVKKAITIGQLLEFLAAQPIEGCYAHQPETNAVDFLLVPRAVNGLISRIGKTIHRGRRRRREAGRVELPEAVRAILSPAERCPVNRNRLGEPPDRVRVAADAVGSIMAEIKPHTVIVEGLTADDLPRVRSICGRTPLVAALPAVFFEEDVPAVAELVNRCARMGVAIEVNSWGGWQIARKAKVRMESGPGLPVLNGLAAAMLARRGITAVTLSPEAGRRQLTDLTNGCSMPCSLTVFGRPPLMVSRVEPPEEFINKTFADRRGTRAVARREHGLWVLRPVAPYDLRDVKDDRIRVKHLVVDLVSSPDPAREWHAPHRHRATSHFNYERGLY